MTNVQYYIIVIKNQTFSHRKNDSQMYICKYDKKLSVIFRGTESKRDVLTDLNIIQIKMRISNTKEGEYPEVHWGFYNQFQSTGIRFEIRHFAEYTRNDKERESGFQWSFTWWSISYYSCVESMQNNILD